MIFSKKKKDSPQEQKDEEAPAEEAKKESRVLSEGEVRQKLREGWIRVILTFEIAGKPKEHVEKSLEAYLLNIKGDPRIGAIKEEPGETEEQEEGIFSAFAELEAVIEDLETLTWISINFMPAAIEVLEPDTLSFAARELTNWYNDLLAKLHETSNVLREERAVNHHLTQSLNALIKNAILAALRDGRKSGEELASITGIKEKQLEPFLKHLTEKGQVKEKDGTYTV